MKAPAVLFLFALLSAALGADDRLIPLDEFSISVPLTQVRNPRGLEVDVWVQRPVLEPLDETASREQRPVVNPLGGAGTHVQCPAIPFFDQMLRPDDQAAVMEACAAALSGQEFRKEVERKLGMAEYDYKTVYEVVTVEGAKRVRIGRRRGSEGGDAFLDPAEGARLKEVLVQAAAAEAWYKLLLKAGTVPVKAAVAHPPKAPGFTMYCKLDRVRGEGLGDAQEKGLEYVVSLQKHGFYKGVMFKVDYHLLFVTMQGTQRMNHSSGGEWVKHLMEQVALALEAVGEKQAFAFETPAEEKDHKFSVTANLAAQRADVAFDSIDFEKNHTLVKGSYAVAQLAQIRAVEAQRSALETWFAEHEGWFFERE